MMVFIPIAAVGALTAAGLYLVIVGVKQGKTLEERTEDDREQMNYLKEWSGRKRK